MNNHIEHIEDLILEQGVAGADITLSSFYIMLNMMKGYQQSPLAKLQKKIDGSPAIIAGTDPESGKFFVATKSLFNKIPKINFTEEDIEKNHGSNKTVARILKIALEELPKLNIEGIIQGDVLFVAGELTEMKFEHDDLFMFTPNTITYGILNHLSDMKKIKIAVMWHTSYTGNSIAELEMKYSVNINNHVWNQSWNQSIFSGCTYFDPFDFHNMMEESLLDAYNLRIHECRRMLDKMNRNILDAIFSDVDVIELSKLFVNSRIKLGVSFESGEKMFTDFIAFIMNRYEEKSNKLKTIKSKEKLLFDLDILLTKLKKSRNKKALQDVFLFHHKTQEIKNLIVNKLDEVNYPIKAFLKTSEGYKKISGEGYVLILDEDTAYKFVNRSVFSKANFDNIKHKQTKEPKTAILTFGRFNPITKGHAELINFMKSKARSVDGDVFVAPSRKQGDKLNPLPFESKLRYMQELLPSMHIINDPDVYDVFGAIRLLSLKGYNRLYLVVGEDRVKEFDNKLNQYIPSKLYEFDFFEVISSGKRHPGISGTEMRKYALMNDLRSFYFRAPNGGADAISEMYHETKRELKRLTK